MCSLLIDVRMFMLLLIQRRDASPGYFVSTSSWSLYWCMRPTKGHCSGYLLAVAVEPQFTLRELSQHEVMQEELSDVLPQYREAANRLGVEALACWVVL